MILDVIKKLTVTKSNDYFELEVKENVQIWLKSGEYICSEITAIYNNRIIIRIDKPDSVYTYRDIWFYEIANIEQG